MTFLRFFFRYLRLGMPIISAWRIAKDLTKARKRWRNMWEKPFDYPERLG